MVSHSGEVPLPAPRLLAEVLAEVNWKKALNGDFECSRSETAVGRKPRGRVQEHTGHQKTYLAAVRRKDSGALMLEASGKARVGAGKHVAFGCNGRKKEQDNSITEIKARSWKSTKGNSTLKAYWPIRLCQFE